MSIMKAGREIPTGIVLLRLLRFQLSAQWRLLCAGRLDEALDANPHIATTVEALDNFPPPDSEQAEDLLGQCNAVNDRVLTAFKEEKQLLFGELFKIRVERQIDRFLREKALG